MLLERMDAKYRFCVARAVCLVILTRVGGFVDSFLVALSEVLAKCKPCLPKTFVRTSVYKTSEALSLHSQDFGSADQVA